MVKLKTLIALSLFLVVSLSAEPPRPSNVPSGAKYDEKSKTFVLHKSDGPFSEWKEWDEAGVLESESYTLGENLHDLTHYLKGRWYSREQYYGFNITKAKQLPPREKPSSIPEKAEFNFDFRKWELGEIKDGKKEGVWRLWWPTGESGGTIEYKNDQYDGKLNMIWENGVPRETCAYVSGKQEGEYFLYHESGKVHYTVKYVHGLKEGLGFQYYETGELHLKTEYVKGNALTQEKYENGKLKERKYFKDKKVIKHEKF